MAAKKKNIGYMGNPNLPTKGATFDYTAEMILDIDKCKKDILYFAENYFFILNLDEGRQKIKLYPAQRRVLKKMSKDRFFCLLASRQIGKSTLMTIYILWLALFQDDQKILLVANKEATAIEIFQRVRMAYEMIPNWLKSPVDGEYGKTSMVLANGSKISISTTTGTAARGQAISLLILDEVAFIEPHLVNEFWASVFPIVSSSKKAKVFMCSTANGTGNLFHKIYTEAEKGESNWGCDKILWNEVPGRDEAWANDIKKGLAFKEMWSQEFECNFINNGTSSLDQELYDKYLKNCEEPKIILKDGCYNIWEEPNPDKIYVAGVDTAEGIGKDFSCIKILDITDLQEIKEVAEYYNNKISVSEFSNVVYEIMCHWGKPLVCIERNNQGGQVADRLGIDYGYEKVVCWGSALAQRKSQTLLGMISSRNTKIRAVATARYFYNDRQALVLRSKAALDELFKDFVKQPNDTWSAVSGKHDDRTMALIWALMILDKELCELYFNIDEIDDCGKPKAISPLEGFGKMFENSTSIYTNEEVSNIEHSLLNPVSFGSYGGTQESEIGQLQAEGWSFLQGGGYYDDPDQTIHPHQWDAIDKYFG